MTRRRATVATLPWLCLAAVLAPRGLTAFRVAFWRPLTADTFKET